MRRVVEAAAPYLVGACALAAWEVAVRLTHTPPFILPGPLAVGAALAQDFPRLFPALVFTVGVTVSAFLASAALGLLLALIMTSSRWMERSLFPYAVILQVTPVVAIAPLIIIWVKDTRLSLLICAWLVAFFPVVSNTGVGLRSADPNLVSLFRLYGASPLQATVWLRLPSAAPYYLAGLRIAGGLSLIGAVVAEFVAGAGGDRSGLAALILEAGYRLNMPRMFAALLLISGVGVLMYALLARLSALVLRHWHDSEARSPDRP
jgi:NitT/TauT family transport system permease protein